MESLKEKETNTALKDKLNDALKDVLEGYEANPAKKEKAHLPEFGKKGVTKSPYKTKNSRAKEKARRKTNNKRRKSQRKK